jgi:CheY-like chemotaxis protein
MHKWADVLIVDDERNMRFLASEVFRLEGITAAAVADGCQALAYFEDVLARGGVMPRVIILDMMMPCLDGFQVYEKICNESWIKDTVLLIATAARDIKLAPGLATFQILYKPYEVTALLDIVRTVAPELFGSAAAR